MRTLAPSAASSVKPAADHPIPISATRGEIDEAGEHGVEDVNRVFSSDDLAHGEVIVVATGVSNGDLLRGVRFLTDSARTHSLVMCMRCNWVRFAESIHFFARDRKEEVRLLG